MPRLLSDDLNELKVIDNLSNSEIVLFYRMPTTRENVQYTNESTVRKRNKIVSRLGETRHKFGAAILEGFREGDFEKKVGDKIVPIASNPGSDYFDPQWKEHIKKYASDLIELLAVHVFESPAETEDEETDDGGQTTEDRGQNTEDRGQKAETSPAIYTPEKEDLTKK